MADDLDGCWADIADPAVVTRWPETGLTHDDAGRADRRRSSSRPARRDVDAVAIEPETHAPQAIRRLLQGEPLGLGWLAPGTSLVLAASLAFERSATG